MGHESYIISRRAAADYTAKQGFVMKQSGAAGTETCTVAADATAATGEIILGIIPFPDGGGTTTGALTSIVRHGWCEAMAGATITYGTHHELSYDSAGELIAATAGEQVVALLDDRGEGTVADGDKVRVWVVGTPYVMETSASERVLFCDVTAGAEASDVRALSCQVKDQYGNNYAVATNIHIRIYEATMIGAAAAAWTLEDGGAGSVVSTTANAALIYDTDANGTGLLNLTDVAGASGKTLFCEAEVTEPGVINGGPRVTTFAFD